MSVGYLNIIAKECLDIARINGFSPLSDIENLEDHKWYLATAITGIHSEASEMYEALRENDIAHMAMEGIDIIIRTLEFLSCLKDADIDKALRKKIEINRKRTHMHGGKLL